MINTSTGTIHRVLKPKENIIEAMIDATNFWLKWKRFISEYRAKFDLFSILILEKKF